ncbi:hypothetical protein [Streptomyces sp. NBC_00209]|uniref:hypothetical protein n=1 Tax=Streptomyces sp. NBC_00209 TaxID=2975682 RepID=UPI003249DC13
MDNIASGVRQMRARNARSAHNAHGQFVRILARMALTCANFHMLLFHMFRDDPPCGVRRDPRTHRKGRLTCGFARAHYVRCGRYGRYLDAEMTLVTLI